MTQKGPPRGRVAPRGSGGSGLVSVLPGGFPELRVRRAGLRSYTIVRYRKVTAWARVQLPPGTKVVSVIPSVMPLAAAHRMAS